MPTSRRDRRLIAVHRGGELTPADHALLAGWAADCAERALPLFEADRPGDPRPAAAIRAARAWAAGDVPVSTARAAAVAAHAAAREASGPARLAARACAHAAATAHMADHELGAAAYALRAMEAAGASAGRLDVERRWQVEALPEAVAGLVRTDMAARAVTFRGAFRVTPDVSESP